MLIFRLAGKPPVGHPGRIPASSQSKEILLAEASVSRELFEFGSDIAQLALVVVLIWGLYQIVTRMLGLSRPTEAEPPADYAGIPARLKPRPKKGAGSVALAEPDDDE
jgi:hypothetical protein